MKQHSILFLEDDVEFRHNVEQFLTHDGFNVTPVDSIANFEQQLSKKTFDAVLLDLELPDGDGITALRALSDQDEMVKVILSGMSELKTKLRGYQSGVDIYFQKPVELEELSAALSALLFKRSKRVEINQNHQIPQDSWILHSKEWKLITPKNLPIPLTNKEKSFLLELSTKDDFVVSKDVLLKVLGYEAKGLHGRKALDVMVTRLRKKIKDITGKEAPIKTIYQEGFQFTGADFVEHSE